MTPGSARPASLTARSPSGWSTRLCATPCNVLVGAARLLYSAAEMRALVSSSKSWACGSSTSVRYEAPAYGRKSAPHRATRRRSGQTGIGGRPESVVRSRPENAGASVLAALRALGSSPLMLDSLNLQDAAIALRPGQDTARVPQSSRNLVRGRGLRQRQDCGLARP